MIGDKKGLAAIILAKAKPKEDAPESEEPDALRMAAEDLIAAVREDDVDGVMSALTAAVQVAQGGEPDGGEGEGFARGGKVKTQATDFKPGDTVRDHFGEDVEVVSVDAGRNQVLARTPNGHTLYHPSKLSHVKSRGEDTQNFAKGGKAYKRSIGRPHDHKLKAEVKSMLSEADRRKHEKDQSHIGGFHDRLDEMMTREKGDTSYIDDARDYLNEHHGDGDDDEENFAKGGKVKSQYEKDAEYLQRKDGIGRTRPSLKEFVANTPSSHMKRLAEKYGVHPDDHESIYATHYDLDGADADRLADGGLVAKKTEGTPGPIGDKRPAFLAKGGKVKTIHDDVEDDGGRKARQLSKYASQANQSKHSVEGDDDEARSFRDHFADAAERDDYDAHRANRDQGNWGHRRAGPGYAKGGKVDPKSARDLQKHMDQYEEEDFPEREAKGHVHRKILRSDPDNMDLNDEDRKVARDLGYKGNFAKGGKVDLGKLSLAQRISDKMAKGGVVDTRRGDTSPSQSSDESRIEGELTRLREMQEDHPNSDLAERIKRLEFKLQRMKGM